MNSFIGQMKYYLSPAYLWSTTTGSRFEVFYLIFPMVLIISATGYRIFLAIKGGRSEAYREFDSLWLWGAVGFGLMGLFIFLSRNQGLPIFSTRLISYLWVILIPFYVAYLVYYYRTNVPKKLHQFYTKKRKARYLGK